jgi:signal transduction histidine kinase
MRPGAATGPGASPGARAGVGRRFGHLLAGAALGWAAVGALATLFLAGWFGEEGGGPRWGDVAGPTALYVALWTLATPGLLLVAERVRFARPAGRPGHRVRTLAPNLARAVALGAVVGGTAVVLLLAYARLATRWADGGAVVNLPEPALFFMGRFRENLLIGALLVVGALVARHRRAERARELEAARLAAQLGEARLQALSMELRPHFLFNTLNAISGMVWADPAKADAMVLQLAELLRRTLEAGESPTSTLAEERHVLTLYLAIQQVRFGPRLTVTVELPPALDAAEVPRFLLQPLVENAFQHGLAPKRGPVSLQVRAERRCDAAGDRLVLVVADDGVGLPAADALVESTGVGNMRRRLAALHGDAQSLVLAPRPGGGTEVTVTLPFRALLPAAP